MIPSRHLLPALLAAMIAFPGAPARAVEIVCPPTDFLNLPFREGDAAAACNNSVADCKATIDAVTRASKDLADKIGAGCSSLSQLKEKQSSAVDLDPKQSYRAQEQIYNDAAEQFDSIIKAMDQHFKAIGGTLLQSPGGPLAVPNPIAPDDKASQIKQSIRGAITDQTHQKLDALPVRPASTITEAGNDRTLFAAVNGASFMKGLYKNSQQLLKVSQDFRNAANKDESYAKGLDNPNDPQDKGGNPGASTVSGGGSGLDLKSLAALATAGTGLASAMQQKNAAATSGEAAATSPTPSSSNMTGNAKDGPSVSKLGDSKSPSSSSPIGTTQPKPATPASPRVPSSPGASPFSDISKSATNTFPTTSSTPATAKTGGGGGGGMMASQGGANPAGDADAAAAAKQAAANANGSPGDDTQGIGGGALGGGGPPPLAMNGSTGAPGAPPDPNAPPNSPESAMGDLLHEMKETAEGVPGAGADAPAGSNDIAMSDEDLFPRVRACYVRIMKAGRVLDGLGEKVTP